MKRKLYFLSNDDDICYSESHFQDIMEQEKLTEIEVFEANQFREKRLRYTSGFASLNFN